MLTKELVTIHCEVPLELDLGAMQTQPPDASACRQLFTELEFTTLLKELAPAEETRTAQYVSEPSGEETAEFLREARTNGFSLAIPASEIEVAAEQVSEQESESIEEREPELKFMSLLDAVDAAEKSAVPESAAAAYKVAVASTAEKMLLLSIEELRELLEDETVPKRVHDLKGTLRGLESRGIALRGAHDDLMLFSYLINPTHALHRLSDVAARFSNYPLRESGDRPS